VTRAIDRSALADPQSVATNALDRLLIFAFLPCATYDIHHIVTVNKKPRRECRDAQKEAAKFPIPNAPIAIAVMVRQS
jgi:hypothetical protein